VTDSPLVQQFLDYSGEDVNTTAFRLIAMKPLSNTHEMNFTTKHESYVVRIRRSVAKGPRKLWIGVSQARLPVMLTIL